MDVKEIDLKGKALQKAYQANEPPSTIINILKELQKGVRPTEDLLRSTRIGITVNKMKAAKQREIAILANEIVVKWRSEVNKQKGGSGSSTPAGTKANGTANGASSSPAPTPAGPPAEQPKKPAIAPDKRNWKVDDVEVKNLTDDSNRNSCIGLLYDGLCLYTTEPAAAVLIKAREVEKAVLNAFGPAKNSAYREKIRSLFQNLKNKSNPQLRIKVLSGEVTPARFANMTHEELKSEQRKAEEEKINKENMDKAMVAEGEKSISSTLQCGKCVSPLGV